MYMKNDLCFFICVISESSYFFMGLITLTNYNLYLWQGWNFDNLINGMILEMHSR